VLCVEVTDERDPFFLHSLTIGEAEFAPLREEQSLRVDFARFPLKLIELLRLCVHEPARFYCALATARDSPAGSPSTLSVVEVNPFKELTHINLGLRCGNDAAIKRYLAARLAQTQAALSASDACLCAVQRDMVVGQDAARDAGACPSPSSLLAHARLLTHPPSVQLPSWSSCALPARWKRRARPRQPQRRCRTRCVGRCGTRRRARRSSRRS